ncbi:unnamed protein product, partial [Prorocentrum cordatum]
AQTIQPGSGRVLPGPGRRIYWRLSFFLSFLFPLLPSPPFLSRAACLPCHGGSRAQAAAAAASASELGGRRPAAAGLAAAPAAQSASAGPGGRRPPPPPAGNPAHEGEWDRGAPGPRLDLRTAIEVTSAKRRAKPPGPERQRALVAQVTGMGFDEPSAKRALSTTGWTGAEAAVTLLLDEASS